MIGREHQATLDEFLTGSGLRIEAFDEEQSRVARQAFVRYGRGAASAARLNLGDCFSYALAKVLDEPLLFKGGDFAHTDVAPAHTAPDVIGAGRPDDQGA